MRYIIFSDLHGNLAALENILEHSNFSKEKDVLISLGDECDIGYHTFEILNRFKELNVIKLVGNHNVAHMYGGGINPYDYSLDPEIKYMLLEEYALRHHSIAYSIENRFLLTHAGVSKRFLPKDCTTPDKASMYLNRRYFEAIVSDGKDAIVKDSYIIDDEGPLWYRPSPYLEATEFYQVAGHTPIYIYFAEGIRNIEATTKIHLIDIYQPSIPRDKFCRYGVIEDGNFKKVEGWVDLL